MARVTSKRYAPRVRGWEHQRRGDALISGRAAFALLMEMRTGKTKIALDDFGRMELSGDAHDLLVHAPAGAYRTWEEAADEHLSDDLRRRINIYTWDSGASARHMRDLDEFMTDLSRPRMLLVNIEAMSKVKRAREACEAFLARRVSDHVVDESTTIKGESKRGEYVVDTLGPLSNYRRILSGLPTPRSPLDAYNQFRFLDRKILGYGSYPAFRAHHAIMQTINTGPPRRLPDGTLAVDGDGRPIFRQVQVEVAYRNEGEIRDKIAPHSYRVLLGDCYDLPPKMYSFRDVEWHPEQRRVYEEIKTFATAQLESQDHVYTSQVVTQLLRLHQVTCGHVEDENGVLHQIPNYRVDSLLDLLADHSGKSVIWCAYDNDVRVVSEAIHARFPDGVVARFWGGNRRTREDEEAIFKGDPRCRWMIGTPSAGGMARQWAVADLVVYFSQRNNLEHRMQSEFRTQLMEKSRSVGYVDLRIPDTVETKIVLALRRKINLASAVTGDNWRQWLI